MLQEVLGISGQCTFATVCSEQHAWAYATCCPPVPCPVPARCGADCTHTWKPCPASCAAMWRLPQPSAIMPTFTMLGSLLFLCSVILNLPVMEVSMPVPSNSESPAAGHTQ